MAMTMASSNPVAHAALDAVGPAAPSGGVSWGAIIAGAVAAAALSMLLLILGTGLGLATSSPWASQGASAGAIGVGAIAWLTFTQIAASAVGGYLAGRLRVRWAQLHGDEVYFRDTAHGLVAWAVATFAAAAFLTSALGNVVGAVGKVGATVAESGALAAAGAGTAGAAAMTGGGSGRAGDGAAAGRDGGPTAYFVDSLFRSETPPAADAGDGTQMRAEVLRIFANDLRAGSMSPADTRYVGQLVARRTGLAPADAEKRVGDVYAQTKAVIADAETKARQAADEARKAGAYSALWMFVAMCAGAFCAALAALYGGRRRDLVD